MAKELFNRYVWLIDTLQRYGRLTRREIDGLWQRSEYSDGQADGSTDVYELSSGHTGDV